MAKAQEEIVTELTATQYVILAENQRKKRALADTKDKYNALLEENRQLLQQHEESQRESYTVTEHLRSEIVAKHSAIAQLQADIERAAAEKEAEIQQLQDCAAAREEQLLSDAEAQRAGLQREIELLEQELQTLSDFKERQAEIEAQTAALREEAQGLREALEAQRTELERYYVGLNAKMRKEYEQKLEELKKAQEEELDERMDASIKRILAQNRRMAEELRVHVAESDGLQAELKLLETERARLLREVAIKSDMEEGFAKRGAKQSIAMKEQAARIAGLEQSLQQVMLEFSKERTSVVMSAQAQVTDALNEAEALRRLVKLKTRELKSVRRLAHEVLLQRSDVEVFLLSSLQMVKLEAKSQHMQKQPQHQQHEQHEASTSSPDATTNLHAETAARRRLDISELSWADRERVLRLLFAKINNQQQQATFSNLPQHPLQDTHGILQGMATNAGPAEIA